MTPEPVPPIIRTSPLLPDKAPHQIPVSNEKKPLQATFDVAGYKSTPVDLRQEVMNKLITELTPDDVIWYRADEFFPKIANSYPERLEPRSYPAKMYSDAYIHGSLRRLKKDHGMLRATIRYLMLKVGMTLLRMAYEERIQEINHIIEEIDNNPRIEGAVDGIPKFSIIQTGGSIKPLRTGFTNSDHDWISETAENIGLTESSFLIVAFWLFVIKCDRLRDVQMEYGKGIIKQFEDHLKMRVMILKQLVGGA